MESFRQEYTMRHAEGRSPQEEIPEVIMVYPRPSGLSSRQGYSSVHFRGGPEGHPLYSSVPYVVYINVR